MDEGVCTTVITPRSPRTRTYIRPDGVEWEICVSVDVNRYSHHTYMVRIYDGAARKILAIAVLAHIMEDKMEITICHDAETDSDDVDDERVYYTDSKNIFVMHDTVSEDIVMSDMHVIIMEVNVDKIDARDTMFTFTPGCL